MYRRGSRVYTYRPPLRYSSGSALRQAEVGGERLFGAALSSRVMVDVRLSVRWDMGMG